MTNERATTLRSYRTVDCIPVVPLDERVKQMFGAIAQMKDIDLYSDRSRKRETVNSRSFVIYALLLEGYKQLDVAKALGRDHSTIINCKEMMQFWLAHPRAYEKEMTDWATFQTLI